MINSIEIAKELIDTEIKALEKMKEQLDQSFDDIVRMLVETKGKVVFMGMGKSGHIARKIAASMSSLGKAAFMVHPGEAMHGDLGMIQKDDTVVLISFSGESDEIVKIIPNLRLIGTNIIGITGNRNSTLAKNSDLLQVFNNVKEACHLGLAPTTSTTLTLVFGDALCVAVSRQLEFSKKDFALFHPAGSLGKSITMRVTDLMEEIKLEELACEEESVETGIDKIMRLKIDYLPIVDNTNLLCGIVTREKLLNAIKTHEKLKLKAKLKEIAEPTPGFVNFDELAIDALREMNDGNNSMLPVIKDEKLIGVITKDSILKSGIYI